MSDLMLDVGQANELKLAMRRAGFENQDVKRLGEKDFMKGVLGLLRGEYQLTKVAKAVVVVVVLLIQAGTVDIPATTEKFFASDKFVINTKASAEVMVSFLGVNFKNWFMDKMEQPQNTRELAYHELKKNSLDIPIITYLGGEEKAKTSLTDVFTLMGKQSHGQEGALLNEWLCEYFLCS